jgi:uncharacterized membrane protein
MKRPKTFSEWFYWILAGIGLVDSAYLIWVKIADSPKYCLQGIGDCYTVNTSRYSEVFGIPIAVFGVLGYLLILLVLYFENRNSFLQENSDYILFGITLIGILYSAYLTYLELFVILAICPFCVLSAIAMTILFILTILRLVKNQAATI